MAEQADFEIISNFIGRVDNLSLPANSANALKPLFEAVSNALHSIDERFDTRTDQGIVDITLLYQDRNSDLLYDGYSVRDNGVGFDEANFRSFLTSDSRHKQPKGGKGVGRLLWLKTAEKAKIESRFEKDGKRYLRTFSFVAGTQFQIKDHTLSEDGARGQLGTTVTVYPLNNTFRSHFPKKRATVSAALIRHFLRVLIGDRVPKMTLTDGEGVENLHERLTEHILEKSEDAFELTFDGGLPAGAFIMKHMLIDKKLQDDEKGTNAIHMCAQMRAVERHLIDNQIGMGLINGDRFYVAVAEGDLFDRTVNQERSSFTLDRQELGHVASGLTERAKTFLAPYIADIRKDQTERVEMILRDSPFFRPVAAVPERFANQKLALHERTDEQIYVALSRETRREMKRRDSEFREVEKIPDHSALVEQKLEEYAKYATDVTKGHLESYVRYRKAILDVLNKFRGWQDPAKEDYVLEKAVHNLICPLGGTSDTLQFDDHNLWMLDERLAFYSYFTSDKTIMSFADDTNNKGEPDLAFFDVGLGFRRDERRDPVIIVEFKRPGKPSYVEGTDPLQQVIKYMTTLREKTVRDNQGAVVNSIDERTVFICYIIADLTEGLKARLRGTPVINPTPDGIGRYGYLDDLRAYIEVIPYEKLFDDAYKRNEIFFKKLGLVPTP